MRYCSLLSKHHLELNNAGCCCCFFLPSGDSQRSKGTSLLRLLLRLRFSLASCRPGKPFAIRCWDMMRQWNTCFLAIANGIYTFSTFHKHMMYNKYIKKHFRSTYIHINHSRLQYSILAFLRLYTLLHAAPLWYLFLLLPSRHLPLAWRLWCQKLLHKPFRSQYSLLHCN